MATLYFKLDEPIPATFSWRRKTPAGCYYVDGFAGNETIRDLARKIPYTVLHHATALWMQHIDKTLTCFAGDPDDIVEFGQIKMIAEQYKDVLTN